MTALQIVITTVALATVAAYACRMGVLHPSRHRLGAIALHVLLSWLAVAALYACLVGAHMAAAPALVVSGGWIVGTLHDWSSGAPQAMRLDDAPSSGLHIDPIGR